MFIDSRYLVRMTKPDAVRLSNIAFTVDGMDETAKKMSCELMRTDWFDRRFTLIKDFHGQPIELKKRGYSR